MLLLKHCWVQLAVLKAICLKGYMNNQAIEMNGIFKIVQYNLSLFLSNFRMRNTRLRYAHCQISHINSRIPLETFWNMKSLTLNWGAHIYFVQIHLRISVTLLWLKIVFTVLYCSHLRFKLVLFTLESVANLRQISKYLPPGLICYTSQRSENKLSLLFSKFPNIS